jgi:hypothetical protein
MGILILRLRETNLPLRHLGGLGYEWLLGLLYIHIPWVRYAVEVLVDARLSSKQKE